MRALLPRDTHCVSRDPQDRRLIIDGRMMIGTSRNIVGIVNRSKVSWNETAHGSIVGVDVRFEEFSEHAGFLMRRRRWKTLVGGCGILSTVHAVFLGRGSVAISSRGHGTCFGLEEVFLF